MAMHVNVLYRFRQKPRDPEFMRKNIILRTSQQLYLLAVLMSLEEQMLVKEYVSSNWVHQLLPRDHKRVHDLIKVCHSPRTLEVDTHQRKISASESYPAQEEQRWTLGPKRKYKKINHDNYFTKLFQISEYREGSGKCRLSRQQAEPPRSMTFFLLKCMSVCKIEALPIRTECTFPF